MGGGCMLKAPKLPSDPGFTGFSPPRRRKAVIFFVFIYFTALFRIIGQQRPHRRLAKHYETGKFSSRENHHVQGGSAEFEPGNY